MVKVELLNVVLVDELNARVEWELLIERSTLACCELLSLSDFPCRQFTLEVLVDDARIDIINSIQ